MNTKSIYPRQNTRASRPVRGAGAELAGCALAGAALILLAACGSAGSTAGGSGGGGGGGGGGGAMAPRQALLAAAATTRKVTSATETLSVTAAGAQSETTSGVVQVRLKPAPALAANLTIGSAGKTTRLKEVVIGNVVYFSAPALTGRLGKPWLKISESSLSGPAGASFAALFHSLQSNNFTNQTELFTAASNIRRAGTGTVDGVSATEYAGSVKASQAIKTLPASFRKAMAPVLQQLGNGTIDFHMWIDGQNQVRKITETEAIAGTTVNTTVTITAINQPVHITAPPAGQTTTPPGM